MALSHPPTEPIKYNGADRAWTVCRYILGTLLIAAAVLKANELASSPLLGPGLLNQRWFLVLVVEIETVLGAWLLLGTGATWTWAATLLLWLVFLGVAGYEAFTGAGSCGCFGRIRVNPRYTACFDLAVVLALPFSRPRWGGTSLSIAAILFFDWA